MRKLRCSSLRLDDIAGGAGWGCYQGAYSCSATTYCSQLGRYRYVIAHLKQRRCVRLPYPCPPRSWQTGAPWGPPAQQRRPWPSLGATPGIRTSPDPTADPPFSLQLQLLSSGSPASGTLPLPRPVLYSVQSPHLPWPLGPRHTIAIELILSFSRYASYRVPTW